MNNVFNSIYKNILKEDNGSYSTTVATSIYLNLPKNLDYDFRHDVRVKFSIEMEARSWGIKSITVTPIQIETIIIEIQNKQNEIVKTIQLEIDPSKLKTEIAKPESYIGVDDLEIMADVNGVIDYNKSSITVYGI